MIISLSMNGTKGKYRYLPMLFAGILIFALGTIFAGQHVFGATAVKGTIKCKSGIVRTEASQKAECAFCVKSGEEVLVLSESKGSDGNTWYKISILGSTGYIRSDLVKKSKEKVTIQDEVKQDSSSVSSADTTQTTQATQTTGTLTSSQIGKVKGTGVNVRKDPVSGQVVTRVSSGTSVTATKVENGSDGKLWYAISFVQDNQPLTGYIRSDFVEGVTLTQQTQSSTSGVLGASVTSTGKIKGTYVRIREKAVNGNVVTMLNTGHEVSIMSETTGSDNMKWYQVGFSYQGKTQQGYVRSDFVTDITAIQQQSAQTGTQDSTQQSASKATVKGTSVRVREAAVNGGIVCQLNTGHELDILSEVKGSDGYTWYQVNFSYQGTTKSGYIRSDLMTVTASTQTTASVPVSDSEFESTIAQLPDSYKNNLRILHAKYPAWRFEPVKTGLDWNEVVASESVTGKNLTSINSISSWKSTNPQAFNWNSDSWYGFDGGAWASASTELIKYYLDPRNFLDETGIFQFETLEYQDYQNETSVSNVLAGSFLAGSVTDTDGVTRSYASIFTEAGRLCGINPYHLAAKCLQEQGVNGTSGSVTGNVPGYENFFNFFNIGAYAASGRTAVENGLIYAATPDDAYERPWNSRYRSIVGSAKYVSEKYVKKGQNTLYFQKFNVVNRENGIYSHQYMTNIIAAASEASSLRKAYTDLNTTLVFKIPYYENMPEALCEKPTSSSNPNCYLSNLWVEGYELSTAFNGAVEQYTISVPANTASINIGATPMNSYASVGGVGTVSCSQGNNTFYIVCKAQNGATKTYILNVVKY